LYGSIDEACARHGVLSRNEDNARIQLKLLCFICGRTYTTSFFFMPLALVDGWYAKALMWLFLGVVCSLEIKVAATDVVFLVHQST
jgi:hypothetical protein